MKRFRLRRALFACAIVLCGANASAHASAQTGPAHASVAVQSAVDRARTLADAGNGLGARHVLDSLVTAVALVPDDLAETLYWRAVLSERAADAELDWKRLIVEAPLSPRAPDALLRLGEAELVRGDARGARVHLEHLVRDFSDVEHRPKAMILIVRSYFDERDVTRACSTIASLKVADVPPGELQLQADELRGRCAKVQQAAMARLADSLTAAAASGSAPLPVPATTPASNPHPPTKTSVPTSVPVAASKQSVEKPSAEKAPASARDAVEPTRGPRYSVQIAAYDTRAKGVAIVKRLATRGIKARVDGDRKPFRVRVGLYTTRAEATAALAKMKRQGQSGFVTESGK